MKTFQEIILLLQRFWGERGCFLSQPYDLEVGAGTFHPDTLLQALGPNPWKCAYVQPSRRPADGRYGQNPNRLQKYHQFQVFLKPAPHDIQSQYLESLRVIGLNPDDNDLRFVEDDWESPTLGAAGLGWEVWCNGMEITQFTYFQQVGGLSCECIPGEITYGLERVAMMVQNVENFYDLQVTEDKTYRDIFMRQETEFSVYYLDTADIDVLERNFCDAERAALGLVEKELLLPAYEQCIKASHFFNMLDARGALSSTERAARISRVRAIAKKCCSMIV